MKRAALLVVAFLYATTLLNAQTIVPSPQNVTAVDAGTKCSVTGSCAVWPLTSAPTAVIVVRGTFSGVLTVEATSDDVEPWTSLRVTNLATGGLSTTITTAGQFALSNVGILRVRTRATTFTSGVAVVSLVRGAATALNGGSGSGGGGGGGGITGGPCPAGQVATEIDENGILTCSVITASLTDTTIAKTASPALTGTPTAPTATAATNTTQIATTAFVFGELTSKAPLASPTFTGTPVAPTATLGTNTTQVATTAFVLANGGASTDALLSFTDVTTNNATTTKHGFVPKLPNDSAVFYNGAGGYTTPSDATKAPLASPTLTGVPAAPTASGGTSTTQVATTAFVQGELTAKAPLASPALTGTPTAPTATVGTNTTQVATTAFVLANGGASTDALLSFTDVTTNDASTTKHGFVPKLPNNSALFYNGAGGYTAPSDATKAPLASPTLTGVPAAPTAAGGTSTTQVATTAFVQGELTAKAPLASPTLTGVPAAPTASTTTNTTQIATTAFVQTEIAAKAPLASPALTGTPTAPTASAGTSTTQLASTAYVLSNKLELFAGGSTCAGLRALLTDSTGTGACYFAGGNAGTPSAINLANATNLPLSALTDTLDPQTMTTGSSFVVGDSAKLIEGHCTANCTAALFTTTAHPGKNITFVNDSAYVMTLDPAGSETICNADGCATTLDIAAHGAVSTYVNLAGTHWVVANSEKAAGMGGGTGIPPNTLDVTSSAYGATGDCSTDDWSAIQAAIDDLPAAGGTILFPIPTGGCYIISGTLTIGNGTSSTISTKSGVILRGMGIPRGMPAFTGWTTASGTVIKWVNATGASMIFVKGPLQGFGIENLALNGNGQALHGIQVKSAQFGETRNILIYGCVGAGIYSTTFNLSGYTGVTNVDSLHNRWDNISIQIPDSVGAIGIILANDLGTITANTDYNQFDNIIIVGPQTSTLVYFISLQVSDNNQFTNVHFSGTSADNVALTFYYSVTASFPSDNYFYHIDFGSSAAVIVNVGTPSAATPNHIVGIASANGRPADPMLANLNWGYVQSDP